MAEGSGGKIPIWVWIGLALVVLWILVQRTTDKLTNSADRISNSSAKSAGEGLGKGLVDSASSALGSFFGSLFGNDSDEKSDDDAGGPVDYSGSINWDRDPPDSDYV